MKRSSWILQEWRTRSRKKNYSPVPNITHRYPDRVLFLVSNQCAVHCRFCTRKRKIGRQFTVTGKTVSEGIAYIRFHREVRDVLISGGDPLMLADEQLAEILAAMRAIPHVEIIRIGTRVPCVLPQRVTKRLVKTLQRFHPLYINTHFNHPAEITSEAAQACALINDAGIPLGCQTVLLKGVNDDPFVMQQLMQKLLAIRVKPYYSTRWTWRAAPAISAPHWPLDSALYKHCANILRGCAFRTLSLTCRAAAARCRCCRSMCWERKTETCCYGISRERSSDIRWARKM